MRALIIFLMFLCCSTTLQNNLIITAHTKSYRLWYDLDKHVPVLVMWKMYNGGGSFPRSVFYFKTAPGSATNKDFVKMGYDKGHMADAQDFAYDSTRMSETFTYYNVAPQTPQLNRGVWKTYESRSRTTSKTDSLLIACGSIYEGTEFKKMGNVIIPSGYWKVVQSLSTGHILFSGKFTNTKTPVMTEVDTTVIKTLCPVNIKFKSVK